MPTLKTHLEMDRKYFGREFPEVHRMLDNTIPFPLHRFTHNPFFVESIRRKYGEEATKSAWLHIMADFNPLIMLADLPNYFSDGKR